MDLQKKADALVSRYNLENRFQALGEVHLVGNVALKTTVKPDIDIQIYAPRKRWQENATQIIDSLQTEGLRDYIQRDLKESGKYLVSFSLLEDSYSWTIDITQTEPTEDYLKDAYKFFLEFKDKLTEENTNIIKQLKLHFLNKGMLHHSMSYYIYRAVLDYDARSVGDVFDYLSQNNINISKFKKGKDD